MPSEFRKNSLNVFQKRKRKEMEKKERRVASVKFSRFFFYVRARISNSQKGNFSEILFCTFGSCTISIDLGIISRERKKKRKGKQRSS